MSEDELQQRVCRACQKTYPYPVPRSLATRFYCAECMELPDTVRATFESFNKRIKSLSATVEQLQKRLESLAGGNQSRPAQPAAEKAGESGASSRAG